MGFLSESGVTALWNKVKANFGRSLSVNGTTITLKNGAATPMNLSQVTIPDATTGASGAMSAADKTKLEGMQSAIASASGVAGEAKETADEAKDLAVSCSNTIMTSINPKLNTLTSSVETAQSTANSKASMEQVNAAIASAQVGAAMYQGSVSNNSTISGSSYKKGWYWVVGAAGTYVGETCEVGDMIFARTDKGGAYSADHFDVVQSNIVELTAAEVEAICVV